VVAVSYGDVKHAVTVEIGGVQAVGLAAQFATERPAVLTSFCAEQHQKLSPRRDHGQVGDAIPVEVGADHTDRSGQWRFAGFAAG